MNKRRRFKAKRRRRLRKLFRPFRVVAVEEILPPIYDVVGLRKDGTFKATVDFGEDDFARLFGRWYR